MSLGAWPLHSSLSLSAHHPVYSPVHLSVCPLSPSPSPSGSCPGSGEVGVKMSFIIPYLHAGLLPSILFHLGVCASRKPWFCDFFFLNLLSGTQHRTWHLVCLAHPVWAKGVVDAKMERTSPVLQHFFPCLIVASEKLSETMHMEASSLILQGSTELVTLMCMDTMPQE